MTNREIVKRVTMGISNNFQLSAKTEINAYKAFRNTALQQEVQLLARKE